MWERQKIRAYKKPTARVVFVVETSEGTTSPWGGFLLLKLCNFSGKEGCSDRNVSSSPRQIPLCLQLTANVSYYTYALCLLHIRVFYTI